MEPPPETLYLILGADGKEYGPVSGEQVRRWISEGRANAASRARVERETEWRKLRDFPEFADALTIQPSAFEPGAGDEQTPIPLPEDLLERDYDLDIFSCVNRGFNLLGNRFGPMLAGAAIFLGVQFLLSLLGAIPLVGAVISLASFAVYGPLIGGLYYYILKIIRGHDAQPGDVFCGFQRCAAHLILCYIVMMILTMLAAAPGGVMIAIGVIPQVVGKEVQPLLMALAVFGLLLCIAGLAFVTVCWMFSLPLVIDKQLDFWPAMETSRKVVMKHWLKFFLLFLLLVLINMVGTLLCCVGVFLTTPVTFAAMMYAYEDIFCRQSPEGS